MRINGKGFKAGVAESWFARARGLSGKDSGNMLFVFPLKFRPGFWMFRMRYPIWISFLEDDGTVFEVKRAEPMGFNMKSCRVYRPSRGCSYVLESEFEVKQGDKIEW